MSWRVTWEEEEVIRSIAILFLSIFKTEFTTAVACCLYCSGQLDRFPQVETRKTPSRRVQLSRSPS